jgi:hypothetical protein
MSDPVEFSPAWFDASSKAWMENKRRLKTNTVYKYICQHEFESGKKCGRDVYKMNDLCRQHWAKSEKTTIEWSALAPNSPPSGS